MVLTAYELAWRPAAALIRRTDAQAAHDGTMNLMRRADALPPLRAIAGLAHRLAFPERPIEVGGVRLPHPIVLAAGLVKGEGFGEARAAEDAVAEGRNIVPGWRSVPRLLGAVELGSFTWQPRLGNPGRVLWRDEGTHSMQNRVGLRNPGAAAAAAHLRAHADRLPPVWGVNLAVSPGVDDLGATAAHVEAAAGAFRDAFAGSEAHPSWYTLNLSCPNTDDDPHGQQSEARARRVAGALVAVVGRPVWVKVGPDLAPPQLRRLVAAFSEAGVRAVVATNTLAAPTPRGGPPGGVSGGRLRPWALRTVGLLRDAIDEAGSDLDIVASGGILRGRHLLAFQAAGAKAAMIYSALVFRGPLAGALILREADRERGRA